MHDQIFSFCLFLFSVLVRHLLKFENLFFNVLEKVYIKKCSNVFTFSYIFEKRSKYLIIVYLYLLDSK